MRERRRTLRCRNLLVRHMVRMKIKISTPLTEAGVSYKKQNVIQIGRLVRGGGRGLWCRNGGTQTVVLLRETPVLVGGTDSRRFPRFQNARNSFRSSCSSEPSEPFRHPAHIECSQAGSSGSIHGKSYEKGTVTITCFGSSPLKKGRLSGCLQTRGRESKKGRRDCSQRPGKISVVSGSSACRCRKRRWQT